jgi:hypothetical protein
MGLLNSFPAISRLGNDLHVTAFFYDSTQPGAHNAVIVRQ